jgi:phage gp46-like protein
LERAKEYTQEALKWLVDSNLVQQLDIQTENDEGEMRIAISLEDGSNQVPLLVFHMTSERWYFHAL